ncbi:MAG TPA: mechanosensitive ion channel family protein [Terriglobia bacterium]|nr:mechanosensitive ion channel family protein [Terriglobia bacterium]
MLGDLAFKDFLPTAMAIAGVLLLMWLALWVCTRAVHRLARRMQDQDKEHFQEIERWSQQLIQFIRRSIEVVAGVAAVFLVLQGLGIRGVTILTWERVVTWLSTHGVRIVLIVIGAYVLTRVIQQVTDRLHLFVVPGEGPLAEVAEHRKRATTITRLLNIIATVAVISVAVLIVLRELNVDITPILAGAGILGLAVGFGAQNVVRDVISGLFIILEDQIRIGDVAIINGKGGLVENIRLRTVVLRGLDGTVHIIQNGAINELSNMTKGFSQYVIDVGVAYKEDTDRVTEVLKEVGAKLQEDPTYADKILAPLEILGVDDFADSAVIIKIRIKTAPIHQWTVGRELRRRIKKAFDEQGIEIPFPHLSVYFGEASKPFAVSGVEQVTRRD